MRALIASDLFYRRFIVDCRYLPDTPYSFWKPFDEGAFWRGYVEALVSGGIADDPFSQAMGTGMMRILTRFCIWPDKLSVGICRRRAPWPIDQRPS